MIDQSLEHRIDPENYLTPAQRALYEQMSATSEECYCASWMGGNEYRLWDALHPLDDRHYGRAVISDGSVRALRTFAREAGGWIVWRDREEAMARYGAGPYFVTFREWGTIRRCRTREIA